VFEAAERARVESLGAMRMPGMATNLTAKIEDQFAHGRFAEVSDKSEAPVEEALALLVRDVRFVALRFGLVFGRSGGAWPALARAARWLGAMTLGGGEQRLAWIHLDDALRLIARAVADARLMGAVNAVAPECPTWRDFAQALAHALHRPRGLRAPAALLRAVLGEMATLLNATRTATVRTTKTVRAEIGDPVGFAVRPETCFLFDRQTGERIR
jgi:NAD dependent epimerase/dehydratase family enzyme